MPPPDPQPPSEPTPRRLLVILDDDPMVGTAIGRLARSAGYASRAFVSAEDYLVAGVPPESSFLVLDVKMARLDGAKLFRLLSTAGEAPPTLFLTSVDDAGLEKEMLGFGAIGWLTKPFDDAALLEILARWNLAPAT